MCLAPVKSAYEGEPFNAALDRKHGFPDYAARYFARGLHFWSAMRIGNWHETRCKAYQPLTLFPKGGFVTMSIHNLRNDAAATNITENSTTDRDAMTRAMALNLADLAQIVYSTFRR